ncbi:MAG: hypothetical protein JWQ38_3689 [Flavipsychrobacter sp.]|nr:hypothetical protein [Flavipsychrobacter sp.]
MKKIFLASAIIASFILCSWGKTKKLQGKGNIIRSERQVTAFNGVEIDFPLKAGITIKEGATPAVEIAGYENIVSHITTKVVKGTLRIYFDIDDNWSIMNDGHNTATITVPSLKELSMSGAATANVAGNLTGDNFLLVLSGATDVSIDQMNVGRVLSDISGVSVAALNGNAKQATYSISGSARIKAFGLQAANVISDISGSAKAEVTALQQMDIEASGAARFTYRGNPTITHQAISGSATIHTDNKQSN